MALCIGYEPPPLSKGENIVSAVDIIIWELSNWPRIAILIKIKIKIKILRNVATRMNDRSFRNGSKLGQSMDS